ncbi:hypothetical protein BC629DRAFT_1442904 [Irpex lacteus]|nr:hypothetical protein BC629DRAFT_1442904 [Irpex lacteus]
MRLPRPTGGLTRATPTCSATVTSSSPHMLSEYIKVHRLASAPRRTARNGKSNRPAASWGAWRIGTLYTQGGVQGQSPWLSQPTPPTRNFRVCEAGTAIISHLVRGYQPDSIINRIFKYMKIYLKMDVEGLSSVRISARRLIRVVCRSDKAVIEKLKNCISSENIKNHTTSTYFDDSESELRILMGKVFQKI